MQTSASGGSGVQHTVRYARHQQTPSGQSDLGCYLGVTVP